MPLFRPVQITSMLPEGHLDTDAQTVISSKETSCHLWGKMSGPEHLEPGWSTKGREGRCTLQCLGHFFHKLPPPSGPALLAVAGTAGARQVGRALAF